MTNDIENKLILACSRIVLADDITAKIREYASQVADWQNVLTASSLHGVAILLYANLKKTCSDLVPEDVMNQLKGMYVSNSRKNLSVSTTLLKVVNVFSANDILAVPFKGPLLAEKVYGNVNLRQFGDLDILIKKKDVIKVTNLFCDHGYEPELMLSGKREIQYLEFENSISFSHSGGAAPVDLHWEMTGRYLLKPIDIDAIKNKIGYVDFLDQKVLSLSDDIMLIYLSMHGTSHCWERLEWLCCFVEMARKKSEKELFEIVALAGEMGCKRILYLSFYLGYDLLGLSLPGKIYENIVIDRGIVRCEKKLKHLIFNRETDSNDDAKWRFAPLHIQIRDTYFDRLKYAIYLYTMPTIKEWVMFPLPSCLTPLYRIIRPLRLGIAFLFGKS